MSTPADLNNFLNSTFVPHLRAVNDNSPTRPVIYKPPTSANLPPIPAWGAKSKEQTGLMADGRNLQAVLLAALATASGTTTAPVSPTVTRTSTPLTRTTTPKNNGNSNRKK